MLGEVIYWIASGLWWRVYEILDKLNIFVLKINKKAILFAALNS